MKKEKKKFNLVYLATILIPLTMFHIMASLISGTLFNPRIGPKQMDEIFVKDYELLSTVTNFLADLEYIGISIPREMMTEMIVTAQMPYDTPISDTRVAVALLKLQNQGYWSIGKRNSGVYFRRRVGDDGQAGFIYSLDGNTPIHTIQHIRKIEPLTINGWFHFELFTTPEQCIDEAESKLNENKELFALIVDYFAEIEYRSIMILEPNRYMNVSNSGRVQIDDENVLAAIDALRERDFGSILRRNRTIHFQRWQNLGSATGIAFTIDGSSPRVERLSRYEPLSKPNWFFYATS